MKLLTQRDRIRTAAKRWRQTYDPLCGGNASLWNVLPSQHFPATPKQIAEQLDALNVETATPEDVAAIIGNASSTRIVCHECGEEVSAVTIVGQEEDYDSSTAYMCQPCLERALALLPKNKHMQTKQTFYISDFSKQMEQLKALKLFAESYLELHRNKTPGTWLSEGSYVYTETLRSDTSQCDINYYGGALVAESIFHRPDLDFIVASSDEKTAKLCRAFIALVDSFETIFKQDDEFSLVLCQEIFSATVKQTHATNS